MTNRGLWVGSGIAGVMALACYFLAIALPRPETQLAWVTRIVLVSAWPILSIIYAYGLYSFVAAECESAANRLAFVFTVVALTTVLGMIVVQLAIKAGIGEITGGLDEQTAKALYRGLRMIDLGLDVAWDMLFGTALILWGAAIRRRSGLGLGWAIPSVVFGMALLVLNVVTFPWPPGERGLIDIGPLIGVFLLALAARLVILGRRAIRKVMQSGSQNSGAHLASGAESDGALPLACGDRTREWDWLFRGPWFIRCS